MTIDDGQAVLGKPEIAELLEVDRGTPSQWIQRSQRGQLDPPFPPADYGLVNGKPAWCRPTVEEWAIRSGRLEPAPEAPEC